MKMDCNKKGAGITGYSASEDMIKVLHDILVLLYSLLSKRQCTS